MAILILANLFGAAAVMILTATAERIAVRAQSVTLAQIVLGKSRRLPKWQMLAPG